MHASSEVLEPIVIPALNRISFPTGWEISETFKQYEQGNVFTFGLKNGDEVFRLSVIGGSSISIGLLNSEFNSMIPDFSEKSLSDYLKHIDNRKREELQIVKAMSVMKSDFERFVEDFNVASLRSLEELEQESQKFEDLFKNYEYIKKEYLQFVEDFYGSIEHSDPEKIHRGNMLKVKKNYDRIEKELEARRATLESETQATGVNAPRKLEKRPADSKPEPVVKASPDKQTEPAPNQVVLESFELPNGTTKMTEEYKVYLKKIVDQFDPGKHQSILIEVYSAEKNFSKARRIVLSRVGQTRQYLLSLDTNLKENLIFKAYGSDNPSDKDGYPKSVVDFSFILK